MTEPGNFPDFDRSVQKLGAILQFHPADAAGPPPAPRRRRWRSSMIGPGLVLLAVIVAGTFTTLRVLREADRPARPARPAAVSVQTLHKPTPPVAVATPSRPAAIPAVASLAHADDRPRRHRQIAARRPSRRVPVRPVRAVVHATPADRGGSRAIADPLQGTALRLALARDREETRRLNLRQLAGAR